MLVFSRLLTSISISWLVNCASVRVFVIDWIIAEMIDSWDDILPVTSKENVRYVVQKKHVVPSRFPSPAKKHTDASSVVCTLINDDKLANQIARLIAIVVKSAIAQIHFILRCWRRVLYNLFKQPLNNAILVCWSRCITYFICA